MKTTTRFGDTVAESIQPTADGKDDSKYRPGKIWEESTSLGDYLVRMAEAETGISTKEQHDEKSVR